MAENEPKTRIGVQFQYKASGAKRPYDGGQEESLNFEIPAGVPPAMLIPDVGDTVVLADLAEPSGHRKAYIVLTRNFSYLESTLGMHIAINIVVTDVDDGEMAGRLKE